eukprot:scaffold17682_cov113-Isochrysis_galbana.AAC.6
MSASMRMIANEAASGLVISRKASRISRWGPRGLAHAASRPESTTTRTWSSSVRLSPGREELSRMPPKILLYSGTETPVTTAVKGVGRPDRWSLSMAEAEGKSASAMAKGPDSRTTDRPCGRQSSSDALDGDQVGRSEAREPHQLQRSPGALGDDHRQHAAREGAGATQHWRLAEAHVNRDEAADVQPQRCVQLELGAFGRIHVACKRPQGGRILHSHDAADGQGDAAAVTKVEGGRSQIAQHVAQPTATAAERDARR